MNNVYLNENENLTEELVGEYKELFFSFKESITTKELSLINNFFKRLPQNEITFDISSGQFTLFLNTIDLIDLEKYINQLKNDNTSVDVISLFDEIYNEINSIKSYGLKNTKRVYIGYNNERKVKNRKEKEVNRNQYYYASDNSFDKTNNILPDKFKNRIICGDSYEILKELPDNCIDLVFTSPPYNFGLNYEANEDAHHWENYFEKLFEIFNECIRVVKYGGRIAVNIQPLFSDYIPSHHVISNYFMNKKMIWKGEILWEKNNYNCKYTAWGSWKSPSNPYLKYTWEFIEVFCKGTLKKEGISSNADISADEFKKWVVSKWSIAPARNMKEFDHPAMFPEELAYRILKLFSFKNDVILDPFNGVGTTTAVARRTGRNYIGIDISQEYCNKAENRLASTLF